VCSACLSVLYKSGGPIYKVYCITINDNQVVGLISMVQKRTSESHKLLLICVDGLSWNLLYRFCSEGVLPNFAKIIRNGVSGKLRSVIPLVSPIIWTTIFTGKKPEKHGVKDFFINPKSIKTKQIWEILQEHGEKVGVFNAMTALEPNESYEFFVPGVLTSTISAHPPDLKFLKEFSAGVRNRQLGLSGLVRYAYKFLKHGCRFITLFKGFLSYLRFLFSSSLSKVDILYRIKELESALYYDVLVHCLRRFPLTFLVFFEGGIDLVCHYYWRYMEPKSFSRIDERDVAKYRYVIKNFYRKVDEFLGRVFSVTDEKTNLIIVSDHGFKANPRRKIDCEINVNSLLSHLDLKDEVYGVKVFHGGIFRPKDERMSLPDMETLFKKVKCSSTESEPPELFEVTRSGPYIRIKVKDSAITNENQRVIMPNGTKCSLTDVINFSPEISGTHSMHGAIIMIGPDVKSDGTLKNAAVFDVTPTILALKRMPIPKDIDGRVLTEAFKEKMSLRYIASYDSQARRTKHSLKELTRSEENHIKQRLKELGYL